MTLHPKIKAATIASTVASILTLAGVLAGAFPSSKWSVMILGVVNAVTPLVAGYVKSAP